MVMSLRILKKDLSARPSDAWASDRHKLSVQTSEGGTENVVASRNGAKMYFIDERFMQHESIYSILLTLSESIFF